LKKKEKLLDRIVSLGYDEQTANGLILSGRVLVNDTKETRAGCLIPSDAKIELLEEREYVSRSALKLLGAIEAFQPSVQGRVCIDLGASTGGFTQVLLLNGAKRVYAIDVAYGFLDFSIRSDERVVVLERKNVRDISKEWFLVEDFASASPFFIVCDISFMSLRTVLRSVVLFFQREEAPFDGIFLFKPQYEASRLTEKGVMKDESLVESLLESFREFATGLGCRVNGIAPSRIRGTKGNQEYVIALSYPG